MSVEFQATSPPRIYRTATGFFRNSSGFCTLFDATIGMLDIQSPEFVRKPTVARQLTPIPVVDPGIIDS